MNKLLNIIKILPILFVCILQTSGIYSDIESRKSEGEQAKELPPTQDILDLRTRIDALLAEYESFGYDIGLKIVSLKYPQTIYELNADLPFTPASNLKLITTGAAFTMLGSRYRWMTDFYINDLGNLYIRASGDPTWNDSYRQGMINHVAKSIADSLRVYGFKDINDVIVDSGNFHNSQMGLGWKEENRLFSYSAKPSVIAFNDNAVQLIINPTTNGRPAKISMYPVNSGFEIINRVTTTSNRNRQGFDFIADPHQNIIEVRGNIWDRSRTQYRSIATPRPDLYALNVLKEKLQEYGVAIHGEMYFDKFSGSDIILNFYTRYFSVFSPPLYEIANEINKKSNNFMANQLFLTISEESWETWGTEKIIRQWLLTNNVDVEHLMIFDGSGLSIYNLCTADILVNILKIMSNSVWAEDFQNSLAISGIDGTLRNAFGEDILHGRVYAKTGFILGARGLSGYSTTADGEKIAFSIIINKPDSRINNFNRIIESILVELAYFSREQLRIQG